MVRRLGVITTGDTFKKSSQSRNKLTLPIGCP